MTETPDREPDAGPAVDTQHLLPAATSTAPPYTDPVEEQGARFAREADEDDGRPGPVAPTVATASDLSPDFLEPTPPAAPA